ncbi:MAG: response regulator transcription factor [Cruoricaptor ignavus]|nr:response regulator transcription factor [Cruoricaptor ignavus]
MNKIKIMICDDHPLITEGLQSFINHKKEMEIIATAATAKELREKLPDTPADILLLDISLPDGSGIDLCAEIKKKFPDLKIIGLSNHNERSFILRMLNNNASGYLIKSTSITEIEKAIREVYYGGIYFGTEAKKTLASLVSNETEIPPVTKREKEVLQYIALGFTSPQIAEKMYISPQTVDSHRKNLMSKFSVNKAVNLVQKAKELGII